MRKVFEFIGWQIKTSVFLLIFFFVAGHVYSQQYQSSKTRKKIKAHNILDLERMPKNKIPQHFTIVNEGWRIPTVGWTGDYVVRNVSTQIDGRKSKFNYVYFPAMIVSPGGVLENADTVRFIFRETTESVQTGFVEKMLDDDAALREIEVEYCNDYLEKSVIEEFKKANVKVCASPLVLRVIHRSQRTK